MGALASSSVATPILVASGHDGLCHGVRVWLAEAGYDEVAQVAATARAIAHLHFAASPHIVVLDFWLPPGTAEPLLYVVDGDATLQRHRYLLTHSRLRTRYSAATQRLITARCSAVLAQPLDITRLLQAVARAAALLAQPQARLV